MLRQRILTAVVLAGLLLGILLSDSPVLFAALLGFFVSVAAWEWAQLAGVRHAQGKFIYALLVTLPLPLLYLFLTATWMPFVILGGVVWWCLATLMVLSYQTGGQPVPGARTVSCLMGYLVLWPAWAGLVTLYQRADGVQLLLVFFAMICLADSAAFFAGRRWGKNKLANRVSPGKTREGFYAGMLAGMIPAVIYVVSAQVAVLGGVGLVALCLVSSMFSVAGDLFISLFKRHADVKDSSHLLPGHGGVLDRIDSITAAAPIFASGVWWLEGKLI